MDRRLLLHQSKRVHQVRDLLRVGTGKTGRLTPLHAGGLTGLSIINRPAAMVLANVEPNERDADGRCQIDGHVCGLGSVKHEEFACASGEMSEEEFVAFLATAFRNQAEVSLDGAIHFQCHMGEMLKAGHSVYSELKNLCVWTKDNGGMGSFYRSQHEFVFVWKVGTEPHVNTVELGKHGRYRTNVWSYAGVNTLKKGRMAELAMHPTVKPVAMIMDAIKDCSKRGEIVLDGFGGSGSTLIAAEKTKRKARLVEYEPRYVDVAVKRWEALTGKKATLADTGETFGAVAERLGASGVADDEAAA
jgi:hypothetical protein